MTLAPLEIMNLLAMLEYPIKMSPFIFNDVVPFVTNTVLFEELVDCPISSEPALA